MAAKITVGELPSDGPAPLAERRGGSGRGAGTLPSDGPARPAPAAFRARWRRGGSVAQVPAVAPAAFRARWRRTAASARAACRWLRRLCAGAGPPPDGRLTVAVDAAAFWEPLTGVGWYLFELLRHLADEEGLRLRLYGPTLFPDPDAPGPVVEPPAGPAIERVTGPAPPGAWGRRRVVLRALRGIEPLVFVLHRNAVLFAPNFILPRAFRLARGATVATVHDLAFRRLPWTVRDETRAALEAQFQRTLARAAAVITVSRAVRGELLAGEPIGAARVTAIHHGPGHLSGRTGGAPPAGTPARYVLHVGTVEPRKNVGLLLAVWEAWAAEDPAAPALLLCGRRGWKSGALHAAFGRAAAAGWLRRPGYVDDDALAALYRGALAVVCPSRYEGFGLPLVEALAAGAPVVASDIPVFREVAGAAALFAPADDPAAWKRTLAELARDESLRRRLSRLGRERAGAFDWTAAAARTRGVLERAARDA